MRRWRYLLALLLISFFLTTSINVYAEKIHEHKTELDKNQIIKNTHTYEKIIVDKDDKSAYQSIQDAINQALTDSTIYIKIGYYPEILEIKKRITIIGEDKEKTIINPNTNKNGYSIRIAENGVKIKNLGIQNKGPGIYSTGIKVSADKTTISNCNIFNTPVGIALWSSNNIISDCLFWGCDDEGIAFLGSPSNKCDNNIVSNSEFFNNCDGIELQYSSNNRISSCKFYDNSHAGIDAIGKSNNNNVITDCELSNNKAFGIFFANSNDNTISKCDFSENKIMTSGSKQMNVEECKLDGIYLTEQSSMTIKDCSNVIKSKIKTVDSEYVLSNIDDIKSRFEVLQQKGKRTKSILLQRITSIITLFRLNK